jgi:hypothetical protein
MKNPKHLWILKPILDGTSRAMMIQRPKEIDGDSIPGDSIPVMMINDLLILCKYIIELQLAVSYIIHHNT